MNNSMINRMKNSAFGKFLRRIAGEETGAVMMEYVIVAVLVAAAAVVAIAYFGKTIVGQTNVAAEATTGKGNSAAETAVKVQEAQKKYQEEAVNASKKFSDSKEDAVSAGSGTK